jgi:hypothetical protein
VKGACADPAKKGETCETVITKEQFEKLADALQPNMAPPIKLRLANGYSRLIGLSQEAEKRGLDGKRVQGACVDELHEPQLTATPPRRLQCPQEPVVELEKRFAITGRSTEIRLQHGIASTGKEGCHPVEGLRISRDRAAATSAARCTTARRSIAFPPAARTLTSGVIANA